MTNTTGKPDVVTFLLLGTDNRGRRCLIGNLRDLVYFKDGEEKAVANGGCASLLGEHFKEGEDVMAAAIRGSFEEWAPDDAPITQHMFTPLGEVETERSYNYLVLVRLLQPLTPATIFIREGYGAMFLPIDHLGAAMRKDFLTEASVGVLNIISEDVEALKVELHDLFDDIEQRLQQK